MADGYISQIKTPDNKVYLLKDSEKTDEKVKQTSNAEDKEFPIILKNTNNATNETNGVKYAGGVTVNPSDETITATEFIGNLKSNKIIPIASKTYPAYTLSADNADNGILFFGDVAINNTTIWQTPWAVHYRLYVSTSEAATQGWYDCYFSINGNTIMYYNYNNFYSTSYRPIYQHGLLYPNNGQSTHGAHLGMRVYSSRTPTTLARIYKVELLEQINCTVTLRDNLAKYSELKNTTYYTYGEYNATSQGLQESGDTNTNDTAAGYIRDGGSSQTTVKVAEILNPYLIMLPTGDGQTYHPINGASKNTATDKNNIYNGDFNIIQKIYYYPTDAVVAANGAVRQDRLWLMYALNLRYSFNIGDTLTVGKEVYMVASLQSSTTATLRNPGATGDNASAQATGANAGPITQTLPTNEDGFIYIYLGRAYTVNTITLAMDHPIYWFKDGELRLYTEGRGIKSITRSGTTFTVTRDDGSTFDFTQQDKYHKSGSWSGLTYTATAVNSADELEFTIPNKIQTNWELNATSGNSPALLFTRDSTLTDWKIFVTSGKLSFQSATDGSTWTERAYFKDNSGDFVATSFTGKGSDLTDLNGSNISSGTVALARLPMGNANTALMGKGSSTAPAYVSVSPSISITAGTADNAPKVNLTVLGVSGTTAQELTKATTGVYGATKLYDGVDSTSTTLAATANAVKTAYDKAAGIVAAADAMVFKGTLDGAASTKYTPAADRGHTYKVAVAGLINGEPVEVGDILICTTDSTAAATSSNVNTVKANWVIVQNNVDGAVFYGSNSLSNGQYLVADGVNGKVKSQALPTASTTTAGITTVGASGGAAAYSHGTHVSYGTSTAKIGTAAAGTASTVSRSDHVHAIDLATGDNNGQVKIAGTNVTVKGLGDRAFDSTSYLPLGGGNMTGNINRYYSTSSTEPMLKLSANNVNAYLFQIGHGGSAGSIAGNYYILKYMGAQDSPNNELQLISAVSTSTEKIAIKINENGVISFPQMNKGNSTKPVYFNAGVFTEGTTYAGGTAVTLNGSSAAGSTAAFYAPTAVGSEGQVLKSQGTGAPTWEEEYKIEIVRLA